ncbi:hypothetical protein KAR91_70705 [Candidatus Pacearchaeota archaeon]|nr:hypothetical protein [Candidatus Pacearchaeota archaeon]
MIATRHYVICGHISVGRSILYSTIHSDNIFTTSVSHDSTESTTCVSLSSANRNYSREYLITRTPNPIDYGFIEGFAERRAIEEMKAGWLKPNKQLKPFSNNSKINYNLPRSRLREKKQIFLLKAA